MIFKVTSGIALQHIKDLSYFTSEQDTINSSLRKDISSNLNLKLNFLVSILFLLDKDILKTIWLGFAIPTPHDKELGLILECCMGVKAFVKMHFEQNINLTVELIDSAEHRLEKESMVIENYNMKELIHSIDIIRYYYDKHK